MTRWGWVGLGLGALGLGVVMATGAVHELAFARGLPRAGRPFAGYILASARKHGLNAFLLAGLLSRESGFGIYLDPQGPGGKGDEGHGHGLAQIDDRTWGAWLAVANWRDPAVNIDKGAEILAAELKRFGGDYTKALAAYNAGPKRVQAAIAKGVHPDTVTTKQNYSTDVRRRAAQIERRTPLA